MSGQCQHCLAIPFDTLFFNDFNTLNKLLNLVTDLEDDELTYAPTESILVARQRDSYLDDTSFDQLGENELLRTFLQKSEYNGDQDPVALRKYFEGEVFATLSTNQFCYFLGTVAELESRAQQCRSCAIFHNQQIWRLPAKCDLDQANGNWRKSSMITSKWYCYLCPIWPSSKSAWKDIYTSPNELYVLPVSDRNAKPLELVDDAFFSYCRDLRTVCLLDCDRSPWKSIPPLVNWQMVKKSWLPTFDSTADDSSALGTPTSPSFMLVSIFDSTIITVASLAGLCYAALSYVWGSAGVSEPWCQTVQREHDRLSNSRIALDENSLPNTLQAAISICRNLEIPYLWIDSLCIAQNSTQNKAAAIADMGHIYMGSFLCIVAATGGNAHDTLPGVNQRRLPVWTEVNGFKFGISPPRPTDAIKQSVWNSRGWTFQEAMLPHRCLVILPEQIFIQSGRSLQCESFGVEEVGNVYEKPDQDYWPEPLTTLDLYNQQLPNSTTTIANPFSVYKDMAENYTSRNLSFQSDAENAFSGLLLTLSRRFQMQMCFALPLHRFDQSLNWMRYSSVTSLVRRKNEQGRLLFPSYTWLSRIGPIIYTTWPEEEEANNKTPAVIPPELLTKFLKNTNHLFPATGFESVVAWSQDNQTQDRFIAGALPITVKLHAIRTEDTITQSHPSERETIATLVKAGYHLDDVTTLPKAQLYLMPIVHANKSTSPAAVKAAATSSSSSSTDAFLVALLVEIYIYPHASVSIWPVPDFPAFNTSKSPSSSLSPPPSSSSSYTAPQAVQHILTTTELQTTIYLARRVGIVPYAYFTRYMSVSPGDPPPEQMAYVLLC